MGYIKLKRSYISHGQKFEIITLLSSSNQNITHIIKYGEKSGNLNNGFEMKHHYTNLEKLSENYNQIFEKCDVIAERLSGWKNVIDKLSEDGFEIIENK